MAGRLLSIANTIRDVFGRVVKPAARPDSREIGIIELRDRYSGYPTDGLGPRRLTEIFRLADAGYPRDQAELYEEMEEKDAHLASALQTRKLAVSGLDWEVVPFEDNAQGKKVADFCMEALQNVQDLEDDFLDIMDAIGKGYSMTEVVWEMDGRWVVPADLRWVHPKKVVWGQSMTPRILTEEDMVQGIEPKPFKTIYHRYRARSGFDMRAGTLRVVAYLYLLKVYAWRDWAVFDEVYGMPLRVGKYDPQSRKEDIDALKTALRQLGADASGVISKDTEIEFIEASNRTSGRLIPFANMIDQCNREMSKAILGQTLSIETQPGSGTLAGNAHADVRQDLVEADASALDAVIRSQLLRPMVGWNFGWDVPVPYLKHRYEEDEDLEKTSKVYFNLSKIGMEFTQEHLQERFGIDQDLTTGKVVSPAGAAGAQPGDGTDPQADPNGPGEGDDKGAGKTAGGMNPDGTLAEGDGPEGGDKGNGKKPKMNPDGTLAAKGAADMHSSDLLAVAAQTSVQELVHAAAGAVPDIMDQMLAPIRDEIAAAARSGASLQELDAKIVRMYRRIDVQSLARTLFRAQMMAWMKAREAHGADRG